MTEIIDVLNLAQQYNMPIWVTMIIVVANIISKAIDRFRRSLTAVIQANVEQQIEISKKLTQISMNSEKITRLLVTHDQNTRSGFRRIEDKLDMAGFINKSVDSND